MKARAFRREAISRLVAYSFLLLPALLGQGVAREGPALPELNELLKKVRDNLHSDRFLLRSYVFNETQEVVELDRKGRPKKTRTRVYEIFPSTVDELTYRRLISKDGELLEEKQLRKQDQEYNKKVSKYAKKAKAKDLLAKSEFEASEEEALRREEKVIHELFRLYHFEIRGREYLDGYSTFFQRIGDREPILKTYRLLRKARYSLSSVPSSFAPFWRARCRCPIR